MIIGISGKIGAGKDTVGKIIQYFTNCKQNDSRIGTLEHFNLFCNLTTYGQEWNKDWQIKKFAYKLKQCVSIITGIPIEDLEKEEVKNRLLGEEWIRYGYANGFIKKYIGNGDMGEPIMNNKQCSKEEYKEHYKTNWQTTYKLHLTVRELLQVIGTDLFRNQLHEDTWVNALMSEYKGTTHTDISSDCPRQGVYDVTETDEVMYGSIKTDYPNWIITDVRFPNEAKAIKDKGGIVIRVEKPFIPKAGDIIEIKVFSNWSTITYTHTDEDGNHYGVGSDGYKYKSSLIRPYNKHESETALDNATFDYIVSAEQGDIESLIQQTKEILIKEKLLCLNENKN